MNISLRPATEDDRVFLFDLHRSTMREYIEEVWGWDDAWQRAEFDRRCNRNTHQIILVDDTPAGMLELERRPAELFIANIQVLPSQQRGGIGSAVIALLLEQARREGAAVTLQVLAANSAARRLYERHGFRVIALTPPHVQMRAPE